MIENYWKIGNKVILISISANSKSANCSQHKFKIKYHLKSQNASLFTKTTPLPFGQLILEIKIISKLISMNTMPTQ